MVTKVQRWGNSLALRIPSALAADTNIGEATDVDLSVRKGRLVITPVRGRRYRLADLLSRVRPANLHREIAFGPPVGREQL